MNLKQREIYGSVINKKNNLLIIPNAKKIGLSEEVRIKPSKSIKNDAPVFNLTGKFDLSGSLIIDLSDMGVAHRIPSGRYLVAAKVGRQLLVTKFTYYSPHIVEGELEIPVPYANSNLGRVNNLPEDIAATAIVSVYSASTNQKLNDAKSLLIPGEKIKKTSIDKKTKVEILRYKVLAEIPGSAIKEESSFHIKAKVQAPTSQGLKQVTLSTLTTLKHKDKVKKDLKINTKTTLASKIIWATVNKMRKEIGHDVVIPPVSKAFNDISNSFIDSKEPETVDLAIKENKIKIRENAQKIFSSIYTLITNSPSVKSTEEASSLTVGISFNPSVINKREVYDEDAIPLSEVISTYVRSENMISKDYVNKFLDQLLDSSDENIFTDINMTGR